MALFKSKPKTPGGKLPVDFASYLMLEEAYEHLQQAYTILFQLEGKTRNLARQEGQGRKIVSALQTAFSKTEAAKNAANKAMVEYTGAYTERLRKARK